MSLPRRRKGAKFGKDFFFLKPLRLSVFAGDVPISFVDVLPDKMRPAVDVEQLSGHEVALRRGQEHHRADQIVFDLGTL